MHHGEYLDSRAVHHGECLDSRAVNHGVCPDNRAWQHEVCHEDRAGSGERREGDRATQHDKDWHRDGCQEGHGQSLEEEKVKKLEQEVNELQEKLQKATAEVAGKWDPQYWGKKVTREGDQGEDRTEDSLRSFPITLPKLPEPTVVNASSYWLLSRDEGTKGPHVSCFFSRSFKHKMPLKLDKITN